MDADVTTLTADYQAAKAAFLSALATVSAKVATRTRLMPNEIRDIEVAEFRLNELGRALSSAKPTTGSAKGSEF